MTKEGKIGLLISKSHAYRRGFEKAKEKGDMKAAAIWKDGYESIQVKIFALQQQ